METKKLDHGQKHLMRLCAQGKKEDGWAPVSKVVWPLLADIPTELVEREQFADGAGRAKLTTAGETVLFWS